MKSLPLFLGLFGLCSISACSSSNNSPTAVGTGGTPAAAGTGGTLATGGTVAVGGGGTGGSAVGGSATGGVGGQNAAAGTGGTGGATGGTGGAALGGSGGTAGGAGGAGGAAGASGAGGSGGAAAFALTSPAFNHVEACTAQDHAPCEVYPLINLLDGPPIVGGGNQSPELSWGPGPQGTLSYVIVLHDYSNMFTHWVLWNIPAVAGMNTTLPAHLPTGAMPVPGASQVAFNPYTGYAGPGAFDHVYEFRLYALNVATFTPNDASTPGPIRGELENDPNNIVLGTTDLRGVTPAN